ncbi:helix-turn-helix domain-containing protein [Thaumasiovibrio sp. DFM-14]|uniref:helix-turn-helix domain-containing protein n=1 Tax=Thaumasiovibrio sp. DFM-14 TaxID=3384792 RepID=UPI0039A27A17
MDVSRADIAVRIRDAREWQNITQVAMAKSLDIARQTYLDLETGKTEPRISVLLKIAELTQRPISWFLYGDNEQGLDQMEQDSIQRMLQLLAELPRDMRQTLLTQNIQLFTYLSEYHDMRVAPIKFEPKLA